MEAARGCRCFFPKVVCDYFAAHRGCADFNGSFPRDCGDWAIRNGADGRDDGVATGEAE